MPRHFLRLPPCVLVGLWMAGILILGILIGAAWGLSQLPSLNPLTIAPDTRPRMGVIRIEGIYDGALTGTMTGTVRLFTGDHPVLPDAGGAFRITDRSVLTNTVKIRAPEGMPFVASRRGKNYYPVASPQANRLAPGNRIYFPDAASAQRAGYVRGR